MNLLYVCSDFGIPPNGTKGASVHLRAITRALADRGHQVVLLSPRSGPGPQHPATPLFGSTSGPGCKSADRLRRWLEDHQLPIAAAGELRALLYNASVVEAALKKLQDRRPNAVMERLSLLGHAGLDLARALDVPLVLEVNALLTSEAQQFRGLEMGTLARRIERRVLTEADAVIVVSSQLRQRLEGIGVDPQRIHIVPNGADVDAFRDLDDGRETRAELGVDEEFVLGFTGSLKVWHGVDLLLAAFQRLHAADPHTKLLIVGTGPTEQLLRSQSGAADLTDAVIFTGPVDHERIPQYLSVMDVAVAPFRDVDGFYFSPIKLFEYMAAGRCIVASRLGQIEEVIDHGVTGLLCKPDDVDDLAETLITVRNDADLRSRLGHAAGICARQRHTWDHAARKTENVITELVARRAPTSPNTTRASHAPDRRSGVATT